jgi:3-oxoacyl-[acyl-carrier protein] reductase
VSSAGGGPARAYVTGASRGIGRAVALALAVDGFDVAIGYARREADARAVAQEIAELGRRAVLVGGDVGAEPAALVDRAADALGGGLDAFVACAVEPVQGPIRTLTAEDFDRAMRVNARGVVLGTIAAAARMEDGRGRIVAVSSTGTHVVRNRRYAPLALAKGAVEAAVRFLAVELAERGIAVNVVAPGPTATEAFDTMAGGEAAALRERFAALTPMGRMGTPADAAALIAFLCSPAAGWITGQLVFSDGGYALV